MGMHRYEVSLIEKSLDILGIGFEDCFMGELGNQRIRYLENYWEVVSWPGTMHKNTPGIIKGSSKYYHISLGVTHDSFDLNGGDGAVTLDLIKPIDKKYRGKYNIVTNFGTSEHCGGRDKQYYVFNNIDKFCCHGGLMIHNVPHTGNWPGHGDVWYTIDFFKELAKIYKYDIFALEIQTRRGTIHPEDLKEGTHKAAPTDEFGNLLADGSLQDNVTCILRKREKNVSVSKSDFSKPFGCESYIMDS